ncbi:hypothetical protein Nepgr_026108 [Nepenthes gracilis]|uniref:Uncharacterized protein n=1 Tax=Nepenthes gracilis TaxID=150966 RepID=A0AAD3T798_NEPGR|nr:hypothetical protein Nepgr_026108 [Nepenthes gracilis]
MQGLGIYPQYDAIQDVGHAIAYVPSYFGIPRRAWNRLQKPMVACSRKKEGRPSNIAELSGPSTSWGRWKDIAPGKGTWYHGGYLPLFFHGLPSIRSNAAFRCDQQDENNHRAQASHEASA